MSDGWTNRDLIIPYAAPYFAYVGLASFLNHKVSIEINYVLKLVIVTGLLIWAWRWYFPVAGPKNRMVSAVYGFVFGVIGLVLWIVCYQPFAGDSGEPWTMTGFYLRLVTASLVVPVFEELLMRGYIFRLVLQWDRFRKQKCHAPFSQALERSSVFEVEPGAWSLAAVMISSVIFALGHTTGEWIAGVVYGVLMCVLYIIRKDLISCMVAHGTTNFGLACYVLITGHWELW